MTLVPDRTCGACSLCCVLPPIDAADFQKQAGVACRFRIEARGCAIHDVRPDVCREWFCGWRQLPLLNAGWRPDLCGVLVVLGADALPAGLAPYQVTKFLIAEPARWRPTPSFTSYVAALVEARAAVYLAAAGPPGHHPLQGLVNAALSPVVAARDDEALARAIARIVADLALGPFEPVVLASAPSIAKGS